MAPARPDLEGVLDVKITAHDGHPQVTQGQVGDVHTAGDAAVVLLAAGNRK